MYSQDSERIIPAQSYIRWTVKWLDRCTCGDMIETSSVQFKRDLAYKKTELGRGFCNQQMVWCATDDSLEWWHTPKHVKLLAHVDYCFVSEPGGTQECRPSHCSQRVRVDWHGFLFFSFSITLLGVLSDHQWEIPLQWKADKWHVILLSGRNPTAQASLESDVSIDICSASINRRINRAWQKNQWCTLSYYLSWPKMNTDVNNKIG